MNIEIKKLFEEMGRLHLHNMTLQDMLNEAQAKLAEAEKKIAELSKKLDPDKEPEKA